MRQPVYNEPLSYETIPMPVTVLPLPPVRSKVSIWLWVTEALYLVIALEMAYMAYWLLASQPIYRVVTWVVLAILWANVASWTALPPAREKVRQKAIHLRDTMSVKAVKMYEQEQRKSVSYSIADHPALTQDTNMYLRSLKKEFLEDAPTVKTACLFPALSHHNGYHGIIGPTEATSIR